MHPRRSLFLQMPTIPTMNYQLLTIETINHHKSDLEATFCAEQFRHLYANPKPSAPSVMAISSFSFSSSALLYAGKSNC